MRPTFDTLTDALAAGWRPAKRGVHKDISGPNSFGYTFEDVDGTRSQGVWFRKDLNQMKQPGCVRPMFPPER